MQKKDQLTMKERKPTYLIEESDHIILIVQHQIYFMVSDLQKDKRFVKYLINKGERILIKNF